MNKLNVFLLLFVMAFSMTVQAQYQFDLSRAAYLFELSIDANMEKETFNQINDHRAKMGLPALTRNSFIDGQCANHDMDMINNNYVSHAGFQDRWLAIKAALKVTTGKENVAYGFATVSSTVTAWLNSPGHREAIEGDFRIAGVAVRKHPTTGKYYYTMFFAK